MNKKPGYSTSIYRNFSVSLASFHKLPQVAGKSMDETLDEYFTAMFPWIEARQEMVTSALARGCTEKMRSLFITHLPIKRLAKDLVCC
ncbi:hypothetical protein [Desulforapulum autotrophicum]|uniref:hypothetical protein n=1 Tax=Desulforapulum autotrophicum TaxID=2296 RepID=UPI00059CAFBD|nr:hypothetical protein [Desulforapulum autotrophicum]